MERNLSIVSTKNVPLATKAVMLDDTAYHYHQLLSAKLER